MDPPAEASSSSATVNENPMQLPITSAKLVAYSFPLNRVIVKNKLENLGIRSTYRLTVNNDPEVLMDKLDSWGRDRDDGVMPVSLLVADSLLMRDVHGGYKFVQRVMHGGHIGVPYMILSVRYSTYVRYKTPLLPGKKINILSIERNRRSALEVPSLLGWRGIYADQIEVTPMTSSLEAMTYMQTLEGPLSDHFKLVFVNAEMLEGEGMQFLDWLSTLITSGLILPIVVSMRINQPLEDPQEVNPQLEITRRILRGTAMLVGTPLVKEYSPLIINMI